MEVKMKKNRFNIAVIPGDGIGPEVISEALKVLELVCDRFNINMQFETFDFRLLA